MLLLLALRYHVCRVSALYCCALCCGDEPPTAIPFGHRCTVGVNLGPTGVLIHLGRAMDQQCASSCVVWIVVAVHSEVVIYKHTPSADARVGSGDSWHLATHRSTTLSCSHARRCARRAHELSSFLWFLLNLRVTPETTLSFMGNSLEKEFFTFLATDFFHFSIF